MQIFHLAICISKDKMVVLQVAEDGRSSHR